MRRRVPTFVVVAIMAGGFVLPASASSAPAFRLTLWPAKAVIDLGQRDAAFTLLNSGSDPQHVIVSANDSWLVPAETSFDLQPGERHTTQARVFIPPSADDGDHDTAIVFGVPPAGAGSAAGGVNVTRALAAYVIIATGGHVQHGLHWDGLKVPRFVDPMLGPVRLSVRAINDGNVHERLDPVLGSVGAFPWENITDQNETVLRFDSVILLRGARQDLRASWAPPVACFCTVAVRGLEANVVVFPVRAVGGLLALLALAWLVRRLRTRAKRQAGSA
jgi:hypothetical protein